MFLTGHVGNAVRSCGQDRCAVALLAQFLVCAIDFAFGGGVSLSYVIVPYVEDGLTADFSFEMRRETTPDLPVQGSTDSFYSNTI